MLNFYPSDQFNNNYLEIEYLAVIIIKIDFETPSKQSAYLMRQN